MTENSFDSIVIGGGSAGLAFAQEAAKLGASILMIERDALGGTCVNRGCVPKKILWAAGGIVRAQNNAAQQGIMTQTNIDFAALVEKRDAHIGSIQKSFVDSLDDADIKLVRGDATFEADKTVTVDGIKYTASSTVIATGGRPATLDIDGAEHLETSDDVFKWGTLPRELLIVGGGYIGCEFAAIFHAMDVKVTLIHDGDHLLDTFPAPLAKHVQNGLRAAGVTVITDDSLKRAMTQNGVLSYELKSGTTGQVDRIISAVGRTPNIDTLGQVVQALDCAESGALKIDDGFRTSHAGVFAIGDVADRLPLTPVATADGTALAHMLFGQGATAIDLDLVATTTFVYPPAAFVGAANDTVTKQDALTPLAENVLSDKTDHASDFYQLSFASEGGRMTGAQIVASGAEDMIAFAAAMIAAKTPATSFERATAVHPSFAEEFFPEIIK